MVCVCVCEREREREKRERERERKREKERDDWLYESLLRVFIPMLVIHCECVVTLWKVGHDVTRKPSITVPSPLGEHDTVVVVLNIVS